MFHVQTLVNHPVHQSERSGTGVDPSFRPRRIGVVVVVLGFAAGLVVGVGVGLGVVRVLRVVVVGVAGRPLQSLFLLLLLGCRGGIGCAAGLGSTATTALVGGGPVLEGTVDRVEKIQQLKPTGAGGEGVVAVGLGRIQRSGGLGGTGR